MSQAAYIPTSYDGSGAFPYRPELDGYRPTYNRARAIQVADSTLPCLNTTVTVKRGATVTDTVKLMRHQANRSIAQVAQLVMVLHDRNPEQFAYNVWHFLKTNIPFKLDDKGKEQVRTAAQSWCDRARGIDCDCFSVFAASLLRAGKFPGKVGFQIVKFPGSLGWQHVYVSAYPYILDLNMGLFNVPPPNITTKMDLQALGNIGNADTDLYNVLGSTSDEAKAQRKALWLGLVEQGHPEYARLAREAMPYIDDVDPQGNIIPMEGDQQGFLAVLAIKVAADEERRSGLSGLGYFDAIASEIAAEEMAGLGKISLKNIFKKAKTAVQNTVKKVTQGVQQFVQNPGQTIKKAVQSVGQFVMKVNPAGIVGRNAYLLLLGLNFRGHASALALNSDRIEKAVKTWKTLGGSEQAFKKAIERGKNKKPLLGAGNAAQAQGVQSGQRNQVTNIQAQRVTTASPPSFATAARPGASFATAARPGASFATAAKPAMPFVIAPRPGGLQSRPGGVAAPGGRTAGMRGLGEAISAAAAITAAAPVIAAIAAVIKQLGGREATQGDVVDPNAPLPDVLPILDDGTGPLLPPDQGGFVGPGGANPNAPRIDPVDGGGGGADYSPRPGTEGGGMPKWVLPVGIGVVGLVAIMAMK